jgi:soluble cytochrome b562
MAHPKKYKSPPMSKEERWYRHGIIDNYDSGGKVDNIPALLTEGEFVIKKESAEKLGYKNLENMNETGELPISDARERSKRNA